MTKQVDTYYSANQAKNDIEHPEEDLSIIVPLVHEGIVKNYSNEETTDSRKNEDSNFVEFC